MLTRLELLFFAISSAALEYGCCRHGDCHSTTDPPCVPGASAVLDLTKNFGQEHSGTCWAGVTRTLGYYFGTNRSITECEVLAHWNHAQCTTGCLTCPASADVLTGPCNNGSFPDFDAVELRASNTVDAPLPLAVLKDEIFCHKRPVAFSYHDGDVAGHILIAYGYRDDDIYVADPAPVCAGSLWANVIPYAAYANEGDPNFTHWNDFYAIHKVDGQ